MKRLFRLCAIVLAVATLASCLCFPVQAASAEPSRQINVVYDDSTSMWTSGGENYHDTWCQAKYAMEVFAAMLGKNDTMSIYYMNDYAYDNLALEDCVGPRITIKGSDPTQANVDILHNTITENAGTPFMSVRKAYEDLTHAQVDEKWLVVLTDGEFDMGLLVADSFFREKSSDVKVMFLSMGASAAMITGDESKDIYCEKAATSDQILNKITGICTRIFNTHKLDVNMATKKFSFDVPMSELVVFAQGENVEIGKISGGPKSAEYTSSASPVEVMYSTQADKRYSRRPYVYDKSLQGKLLKFEGDFDAGDYTIDVKNAKTVEIYYKPNVEIEAFLVDNEGSIIKNADGLKEGSYTLKFGFVKAGTLNAVPDSELLGDITYTATVTNNGVTHEKQYASGDTITIEEGDLTISASASYLEYNTVSTYLEYRVYKNKEIGFQVSEDTEYTVFADGLDPKDPIKFKLTLDGKEFTQEQWNSLGSIKVALTSEEKFKMGDFKAEKTSEIGIIAITPTLEGQELILDDYDSVDIKISISDIKENEVWSGSCDHTVQIKEGRSWFERFGIYVIICLLVLLAIALIAALIYWWRTHKVFPDTVELCEYLPAVGRWADHFIAVRIDEMICITNSVGIIIFTAAGIKSCPNYKRSASSATVKVSGVSTGAAVASGLKIDGEAVGSDDQVFTLGDETVIKYFNGNGAEVKFKIRINRI
ncbi:MAG: hypothetical protein E7646_05415 [Ruminococcaceae bacterium]|nr:hypothetical protein [Oscillospiraceae bacterium]